MSKRYLLSLTIAAAFVFSAGIANAYPQTMFGTGYGFSDTNRNTGVGYTRAVSPVTESFAEDSTSKIKYTTDGEQNVSTIIGNPDEAANAGYRVKTFWTKNDGKDYNPYTGASSGVDETRSIYTDDLGRLHFFGKGSRSNK